MIELPDFNQVAKQVAQETFDKIVIRTPVDSGRAQRGWELELSDTGENRIWNDEPYIGVLENGSSDQAPNGFIRITLEEVPDMIARAIEVQVR